jgi:spermidine synthase
MAKSFIDKNLKDLQVDKINKNKIQIINCDGLSFVKNSPKKFYDLVLFDGYKPEVEYLREYERVLQSGGMLLSANSHLSQSKTLDYFKMLENKEVWEFVEEFGDTRVYKRL